MDSVTATLASAIGARVKRERQSRQWTLDHLAEVAGISRRAVINIEQGETNPSVGTLLRISDALGIGLPALVEPPEPRSVKVTRAGNGATLWTGKHGGCGVLVAGTGPPDVLELWDWALEPGEAHDSEAHTSGTAELLQVQFGRIMLTVDDRTYDLGPGDAISFPGDAPHTYRNQTSTSARFCLSVYEPGVGVPATRPI